MEKFLHVVSFNIPFPADYGGVIDVYYKLKALQQQGVKVILHCFHYGRPESAELNEVCHEVHYYKRKNDLRNFFSKHPYIVSSRRSKKLLKRLAADDHPILFEGLHTCFYLDHPSLKNRFKAVRMHNVEWEYYNELSKAEDQKFKKLYLKQESLRLKKFEEKLDFANLICAISPKDTKYLSDHYKNVIYVPAFHENENVVSHIKKGSYCLYHGNLSVAENEKAALFLVKKVFSRSPFNFKIAGLDPTARIREALEDNYNIELIQNPSNEELDKLIMNAHINILPSFQSTGIKLKLINALYKGRFCVVNTGMVAGTGLEELCLVADEPIDIKKGIEELIELDFTEEMKIEREKLLISKFSNEKNAKAFISQFFDYK